MKVTRLDPGKGLVDLLSDQRERLRALESAPAGSKYIQESITTGGENGVETIFGQLPDGSYGIKEWVNDITPPNAPSAPRLTAITSGITVDWDGKDSGGQPQPPDYTMTEVEYSKDSVVWQKSQQLSLTSTSTFILGLEHGKQHWVRLRSYDTNGNASAYSMMASATPLAPVGSDIDIDELRSEFQENTDQLQRDLLLNRDRIATAEGDITAVKNRVTPIESTLTTLNNSTLPAIQSQLNGINKTYRSTANASGNAYRVGDIWEKYNTLSPGGKLLATWRYESSGWISYSIDPVYIPQINIGTGTFGELDGGRLTADSVKARSLVIGGLDNFANLAVDADMWDYNTVSNGTVITAVSYNDSYQKRAWEFSGNSNIHSVYTKKFPVVPGERLWVSSRLRNQGGAATVGPVTFGLQFLDSAGAVIGWDISRNSLSTVSNIPVQQGDESLVPAGAAYARAMATTRAATGTADPAQKAWVIDPRVARMTDGTVLVNGSVKAIHVDAESVAAAVGTFVEAKIENLVVTGNANLKTVVAERIAANTGQYLKLFASQIFVGEPGNIFPDPNFLDPEGWLLGTGVTITTGGGRNGNNSFDIAASSAQVGRYYANNDKRRQFRVTGGSKYLAQVWVKSDLAVALNQIRIYSKWGNPSSVAGGTFTTPSATGNTETIPANTWYQIKHEFTVDEAATTGLIGLYVQGTHNSRVLFSELSVRELITPFLVVDGLVSGQRIVGANIETNSATARGVKINDSGMFAYNNTGIETLRFDGVNSIITGATIRTAATGARIQMSTTGLEGWNASNTRYLLADAAGLTMEGRVVARGETSAGGTPTKLELGTYTVASSMLINPPVTYTQSGLFFTVGEDYPALTAPPGITSSGRGSLAVYGNEVTFYKNHQLLPMDGYYVNAYNITIGAYANATHSNHSINLNAANVLVNGYPAMAGPPSLRTRLTLTNSFTQWTGSSWNGLWLERLGNLCIITGAVGRSGSWTAGTVCAVVPAAHRPASKVAGVEGELDAAGNISLPAGATALAINITYFAAT